MDCTKVWCVARDPLAKYCTENLFGIHWQVRTCASLFRISETAGRTALKFGVWLGDHWLYVLHVLRVEHIALAYVHHIPVSYLSNRETLCSENWCVVRHALTGVLHGSWLWNVFTSAPTAANPLNLSKSFCLCSVVAQKAPYQPSL